MVHVEVPLYVGQKGDKHPMVLCSTHHASFQEVFKPHQKMTNKCKEWLINNGCCETLNKPFFEVPRMQMPGVNSERLQAYQKLLVMFFPSYLQTLLPLNIRMCHSNKCSLSMCFRRQITRRDSTSKRPLVICLMR